MMRGSVSLTGPGGVGSKSVKYDSRAGGHLCAVASTTPSRLEMQNAVPASSAPCTSEWKEENPDA